MNQENIILNVETKNSEISLKDLRKELNENKNALLNLQQGTEEYNTVLERSAEIQRTLTDLNQEVKQSYVGLEDVIGNAGKVAGDMMNGLNGLRSITMLVAGSNSDAAKSIETMMQIMTAAQGLNGISGMIKGFKNLIINLKTSNTTTKALTITQRIYNAVLKANPIFLIVGVIAAVIGALELFNSAMKKTTDTTEENNTENKKYGTALEVVEEKLKNIVDLETQLKYIRGEYSELDKLKDQLAAVQNELDNLIEGTGKDTKLFVINTKEIDKAKTLLIAKIKELQDAIAIEEAKAVVKAKNESEKQKQTELDNIEKQKQTILSNLENQNKSELDKLTEKFNIEYNLLSDNIDAQLELIINFENEKERINNEAYEKQKEEEIKFQEELKSISTEYGNEAQERHLIRVNNEIESEKEKKEEIELLAEKEMHNRLMIMDATAGALDSIASLFEQHTVEYKAIAAATVIIDTLKGIMGIWSGVKDPFLSTTVAAVQSAALGVTGAVNLKKILAVNPKGEGNAGKLAQPNISRPSAPAIDNSINFIRNAQTEDEVNLQNQPVKAYVVETELRSVSNRMNQTEQESSF